MATQKSEKIIEQEKWFIDRIGKRVFRGLDTCTCESCKSVSENGLIIIDKQHAIYLSEISAELGLKYFDEKQMKQKIYISGAISGREKEPPAIFEAAEKKLIEQGFEVVNPYKLNHEAHDKSWASYMRVDLIAMLDGCTAIYMLYGWEISNGARVENYLAVQLGFDVIYEGVKTDK